MLDPIAIYRGEDAIAVMREAFKSFPGLPPLAACNLPNCIRMFPIDLQMPIG